MVPLRAVIASVLLLGVLAVVAGTATTTAQDSLEPTVDALRTRVAEQATSIAKRDEKIDRLQTRVAELKSAEPAATQAPTPDPDAPKGTRANPIPIGTTVMVGSDWAITVVSTIPYATDLVLAENMFNEAPGEGKQFYIARIRAEYLGNETATFTFSVSTAVVGQSNIAYEGFDAYCGVIPDPVPDSEVFPGAVIEGNICWNVATEDVDSLVLFADEAFSFDSDTRVYLALK